MIMMVGLSSLKRLIFTSLLHFGESCHSRDYIVNPNMYKGSHGSHGKRLVSQARTVLSVKFICEYRIVCTDLSVLRIEGEH
jgi:hypothetical protein